MRPRGVAPLVLGMLVFSGCVVGDAEQASNPSGSDIAPPPEFDETTGAIHGIVTDEEGQPLPEVQVGIIQLPEQAMTTGADGAFTFSRLEPGTYTVAAGTLGYASTARNVDVIIGQVTELTLILAIGETEVGYPNLQIMDGMLACSVRAYPGAPLWVPDEEQPTNTSRGTLAPGWYTGVAVCGLNPINSTMGDKFLLSWTSPDNVQEIVLEMRWSTTQATGRGLTLNLEDPRGINNGRPIYGTDTGVSPLRIDANQTKVLLVSSTNERDCVTGKCAFTSRVFAEANTTELYLPGEIPPIGPYGKPRNKVDAGVVLNQRFTQYLTTFHRMNMTEGYTALTDV